MRLSSTADSRPSDRPHVNRAVLLWMLIIALLVLLVLYVACSVYLGRRGAVDPRLCDLRITRVWRGSVYRLVDGNSKLWKRLPTEWHRGTRIRLLGYEASTGTLAMETESLNQKTLVLETRGVILDNKPTHIVLARADSDLTFDGRVFVEQRLIDGALHLEYHNLHGTKERALTLSIPGEVITYADPVDIAANGQIAAGLVTQQKPGRRIYLFGKAGQPKSIGHGYLPRFSPTGDRIVYVADQSYRVCIYNCQEQNTKELVVWHPTGIIDLVPVFGDRPSLVTGVQWSGDGEWLVSTLRRPFRNADDLLYATSVSADGGWCRLPVTVDPLAWLAD